MKSYISDPEDLKQDPLYQETWDDMILNVCIKFELFNNLEGSCSPVALVQFSHLSRRRMYLVFPDLESLMYNFM